MAEQLAGRVVKMRILAMIPAYGDETGAFITMHEFLTHLVECGHSVDVVATIRRRPRQSIRDGVRVQPTHWRGSREPDVVISNHNDQMATRLIRFRYPKVPHLLMVHGEHHLPIPPDIGNIWFPSWAAREWYGSTVGAVIPPPINPKLYQTTPGSAVTLMASSAAKGGDVLLALAERMPETHFMCVHSFGHLRELDRMPNVQVIDRIDPRAVYSRTRVLLMPSKTETYGRVGLEAMVSGIPVIAASLPALQESLGPAALFCTRDDIDGWESLLLGLRDQAVWSQHSGFATLRAGNLDYAGHLAAFELLVRSLV